LDQTIAVKIFPKVKKKLIFDFILPLFFIPPLELKLNIPVFHIALIVYADASFAVHLNIRSHTGTVITLWKGAIYAKSSKQKLLTKSSTESELVAISDAMEQAVWTKNFVEAQGCSVPPIKVFLCIG
jgi:hypothetical protein